MDITAKISADLQFPAPAPDTVVYAKEGDSNTRKVEINLFSGGVAWSIPTGSTAVIRFQKPDHTGGLYDRLPDGSIAYMVSADRSAITITLAPQVLTACGQVHVDVVIINGSDAIATFDFIVKVAQAPSSGTDTGSQNYYNYQTLAEINDALKARVQTVNGIKPDAKGNVNVSGGSGGNVLSVNGKTGAVNLTADDVGAVPCQYSEGPDGATYELAGHIDMVGHKINRLGDPAAADDAVTKAYVDRKVQEAVGSGGEAGGYYAPSVDSGGNLTWTASKAGMPQVSGANIKGPKGDTGQQGPAGANGTPITWQGEWVARNVYAKNDAVSYDGSAWVMTEGPVVGAVPGVDSRWALMARKGADGGNGVGIASIARTSGTGAAGTTDTYTITLTDGSTSTFTVYNGKDGASGSGSSAVTSVNGKTGDVKLPVSGFGSCATAASTAIKVVDGLPEDFLVQDGAQLCVKFSNANTAAMPKLSVAGASATIFDARTSYNVDAAGIGARTHHFVYFSGIWVLLDAIQIPVPTSDDHGKFLRVSGHAYVLEALTDVSEVRA